MQPPPRGCVLKQPLMLSGEFKVNRQPPPRGCVLKPFYRPKFYICYHAAASARLCVETFVAEHGHFTDPDAAASARLCVETTNRALQTFLQ